MRPARDRRITGRLCAWFEREQRALPWRAPPRRPSKRNERRDPYRSFVSEAMLQQTQVSRVIERFGSFMDRFPNVRTLAAAPEHDVLAEWSGLGYYRRARNLHAAAKAIVDRHSCKVPDNVESLLDLPGAGRYTAGAIASIVFNQRVPAVDGNVQRVLLRLEGRDADESARKRESWVWLRAEELVRAAESPGEFNEGLMELGALVCTPRKPRCGECPLAGVCEARRRGIEGEIPAPKKRPNARPTVFHAVAVLRDGADRVALVCRENPGLWRGLWQPPGLERDDRPPTRAELSRATGAARLTSVGGFRFLTTHRVVQFSVWRGNAPKGAKARRFELFGRREWPSLPLATPHRRILDGEFGANSA